VLHSCIRRSYYYYNIRYNAPTTTSTVDPCFASPKRPPSRATGLLGRGLLRSALGSCGGCKWVEPQGTEGSNVSSSCCYARCNRQNTICDSFQPSFRSVCTTSNYNTGLRSSMGELVVTGTTVAQPGHIKVCHGGGNGRRYGLCH
jgi:hypothetical protein